MENTMNYKGYVGSVEYSEADGIFYGKVLGIRSLVSYEGGNLKELENDFHKAVNDYLAPSPLSEKSLKSPSLCVKV